MTDNLSVEVPTKWWKLISTNHGYGMAFTGLEQDIRTDLADFAYTESPPTIVRNPLEEGPKHGIVTKGKLIFSTAEEAVHFVLIWGDFIANDRYTWERQ